MRVKIDGCVFDSENTPIALIFEDDSERKNVANLLTNMREKDSKRALMVMPECLDNSDFIQCVKEIVDSE